MKQHKGRNVTTIEGNEQPMPHKMTTALPSRHVLAIAIATLAGAQTVQAAGFALIEQSVSGMGTAYAGAAASADSVDTLFFNPAGMTRLPGTQGGAAVHLVLPQTKFHNDGSTFALAPLAISGSDGGDAGGLAGIPHFYLTHQLNEKVWVGLALNVPFGLTTEYQDGWVGRYHAIKSHVETVNINPSIAFKASDKISLAAGINAMYLKGEFSSAIDFGTLYQIPAVAGGLDGTALDSAEGPGGADGKSTIKGDAWGWGYNVGALFELSDRTRLGIHYRSEVEQNIEGDVKFTLPSSNPLLGLVFSDAGAKASVDLPATASVSGFHQFNEEWAIMADYTWTGWSSIPHLTFQFDNTVSDNTTTFDWKDTDRVSIGTTFKPAGGNWTYRLGAAFDESPVPNKFARTARLPDADRIWLGVGAGFSPSENLTIDFGYAHLFIDNPEIAKLASDPENVTRGVLKGSYDSSVDILSIEARYRFF